MAGKRKTADEENDAKKAKTERQGEDNIESNEEFEQSEMRIVSFNVNGLYAAVNKDFCQNMLEIDPDIICLQGIDGLSYPFYN